MNNDTIKGNWNELKGKVRQAWGRLTDDEVAETKGNWEELSGKIQKTYGYTKDQAQEEVDKFKATHKLS